MNGRIAREFAGLLLLSHLVACAQSSAPGRDGDRNSAAARGGSAAADDAADAGYSGGFSDAAKGGASGMGGSGPRAGGGPASDAGGAGMDPEQSGGVAGRGGSESSGTGNGGAPSAGVGSTAASGGSETGGADAGGASSNSGSGGSGAESGGGNGNTGAGGDDGERAGAGGAGTEELAPNSMGWAGCTLAEDVALGYVRIGGTRLRGPWGSGLPAVQDLTDPDSAAWYRINVPNQNYGVPTDFWIMICTYGVPQKPTLEIVRQIIAAARVHTVEGATIYITGQPFYEGSHECSTFAEADVELTDRLAQEAAAEADDVIYPGRFGPLGGETLSADNCHPSSAGQDFVGEQALAFWH